MDLITDQTILKQCSDETIAWLHQVFELTEKGMPISADPFYERTSLFTKEKVEGCIDAIEAIFVSELKKYPGYHRNAQGISADEHLVPPGFDKMEYSQKLAIMQGIDKIFCKYKKAVPETKPVQILEDD